MKTTLIIGCIAVAIVVIWLLLSAVWMSKQSLVGFWIASLPNGTDVTIQFEGTQKGGNYKEITRRGGAVLREAGHWTVNLADLRLIIMATDIKENPRFGVDTQYWVTWQGKNQITIDGPERAKWVLRRAKDAVNLDFGAPNPGA